MRIFRYPPGFYRVNRRHPDDLPPDAARRADLVAWIDGRRQLGLTRAEACHLAGVSTRSYNRWKLRLRRYGVRALAARSSRPHRARTAPVRRSVAEHVERLRLKHPLGKEKLAILLAREGIIVSASTVGRVLRELTERGVIQPIGYARRKSRTLRRARERVHARRKRPGERAMTPGQLVQIDTLHEYSNETRRVQFSAVDPITRFVHARIFTTASSNNAKTFLQECLARWPHPITSVQVDNGSEFKGHHERACQELNLELVTIPKGTPKANGQVERLQRTFRDEHYAFEPPYLTYDQANQHLDDYVTYYNQHRPHKALAMSTPNAYPQDQNPRATPN